MCPPGLYEEDDWLSFYSVNFGAAHRSKLPTLSRSGIGWFGEWKIFFDWLIYDLKRIVCDH